MEILSAGDPTTWTYELLYGLYLLFVHHPVVVAVWAGMCVLIGYYFYKH